jgi:hypothetical protein
VGRPDDLSRVGHPDAEHELARDSLEPNGLLDRPDRPEDGRV